MADAGEAAIEFHFEGTSISVSPTTIDGGNPVISVDSGIIVISSAPTRDLQRRLGSLIKDHPGVEEIAIGGIDTSSRDAIVEVAQEYGLGVQGT